MPSISHGALVIRAGMNIDADRIVSSLFLLLRAPWPTADYNTNKISKISTLPTANNDSGDKDRSCRSDGSKEARNPYSICSGMLTQSLPKLREPIVINRMYMSACLRANWVSTCAYVAMLMFCCPFSNHFH